MRVLRLLRHAKSSWSDASLADVDRPLKRRGKRACVRMAAPLAQARCFEHVYCSPARRAQQTLEGIRENVEVDFDWQTEDALYAFDVDEVLDFCRSLPDDGPDALIVGHNPAFTELANRIGDRAIDNVPTCGYVEIELPAERWSEIAHVHGVTRAFLYPKLFEK